MIRSFRHNGLAAFFMEGDAKGIRPDQRTRCQARLNALHVASKLGDLNVPGFDPHRLRGKPTRYAIKVNGPFRITFEWIDGDAWRVDLEQYH